MFNRLAAFSESTEGLTLDQFRAFESFFIGYVAHAVPEKDWTEGLTAAREHAAAVNSAPPG
jgi:hypothetical protein